MSLTAIKSRKSGVAVLSLYGELDIEGTDDLKAVVTAARIESKHKVVIDLSHVKLLGSSCIDYLTSIGVDARR